MALFHITIEKVVVKGNDELLEVINGKLDRLLGSDTEVLKNAAADLDASTNDLKEAVDKNTQP